MGTRVQFWYRNDFRQGFLVDGDAEVPYDEVMNMPEMKPILLAVSASGRVEFSADVLQHLGVEPGGKIDLELLPDGRALIGPARVEKSTNRSVE